MEKEIVKEYATLIEENTKRINKLQRENANMVLAFFEKVFEENDNEPIYYEGVNKGDDNLIIDDGDIIEIDEIFVEDDAINVKGHYDEDNSTFVDELINLEDKNIVGVFEMFKNQF